MFLKKIKRFSLKKRLKKQLCNVKEESLLSTVSKIGLVVDESDFLEINALKEEILLNGIIEDNIKIITYRDGFKDKIVYSNPTFGYKDLNSKGEFVKKEINDFVSEEFDLLISYYADDKPFLLLLTNNSKAKFKVGFSSVDKRLNHLLINTSLDNYKVFTKELFRYLKILNKI